MSKSSYPPGPPQSVKDDDASAVETATEFLKARAGDAKPSDILSVLVRVPDASPMQGDEV